MAKRNNNNQPVNNNNEDKNVIDGEATPVVESAPSDAPRLKAKDAASFAESVAEWYEKVTGQAVRSVKRLWAKFTAWAHRVWSQIVHKARELGFKVWDAVGSSVGEGIQWGLAYGAAVTTAYVVLVTVDAIAKAIA